MKGTQQPNDYSRNKLFGNISSFTGDDAKENAKV
jgi:hypothetical protein